MVRLYEKRQQFHKIHGKGALGDIWRSIKGLFYRGSTKAMPHIKNYAGQAIDYGKNLAGREVQRLVNQGTEYAREKARELANQAIDNPRQIENILRETRDRVKEDALNKLHREKRYFHELADSTAYDFRNHAQHLANDFRNHAHYGVNSAIDHLHHSASNAIQRIVPGHEPVTSVHTSHNVAPPAFSRIVGDGIKKTRRSKKDKGDGLFLPGAGLYLPGTQKGMGLAIA